MVKKAESLEPNDQYREVYLFLSKILSGEFPDIENTSDHTIMVILLLLQDLNKLIKSTDCDLHGCLTGIGPGDTGEHNNQTRQDLRKRLISLFKFHRINQFINPLQISSSVNEKVYRNTFKWYTEQVCHIESIIAVNNDTELKIELASWKSSSCVAHSFDLSCISYCLMFFVCLHACFYGKCFPLLHTLGPACMHEECVH